MTCVSLVHNGNIGISTGKFGCFQQHQDFYHMNADQHDVVYSKFASHGVILGFGSWFGYVLSAFSMINATPAPVSPKQKLNEILATE